MSAANPGGEVLAERPATDERETGLSVAHGVEVWSSKQWRTLATGWLDAHLEGQGIERTGPVEQPHLRPWATALRAPTTRGDVWLKAAGPSTGMEVDLYAILDTQAKGRVLAPLAIDTRRHWMVLPDGGPVLGAVLEGTALVDAMCAVVPAYAQLQLDLVPSVDDLLAVGVPDLRPHRMPERLREALERVRPYVDSRGSEADQAAYEQVVATREQYEETCAVLAAGPVQPSLQHDDLHPWNVFADHHASEPVFFDWGDSVVAHPFASMLVTLRIVKHLAKVGDDSPEVLRVRDAYLEPFTHLAAKSDLVDLLEQACHVGKVGRALSWARVVDSLTGAEAAEEASAPWEWLSQLLHRSYLGDLGDD